jgi:acetoin utilization deacetylase AcuC-like enzyme
MAFIAWHPLFKLSLPEGHRFPMQKYALLHDQLLNEGLVEEKDFFQASLLDKKHLKDVHRKYYWQKLLTLELTERDERRLGLPLSEHLIERELRIVQGTLSSAETALETGIGFTIAGGTHHAGSDWGEGFCLLNDQAVAARYLLTHHNIDQILIVDLDVHQGNGTAEIFEDEEQVFTFSMHGKNNFPFKKEQSDLDVGLEDGTKGPEYLPVLEEKLEHLFTALRPDFVFYQAGTDVLQTDKLGRLSLTEEDCRERDRLVFSFCKNWETPVQVSMGGGYSEEIKDIVNAHCHTYREGISAILY